MATKEEGKKEGKEGEKGSKLVLIVGLASILLGGGGLGAYVFLSGSGGGDAHAENKTDPKDQDAQNEKKGEGQSEGHGKTKKEEGHGGGHGETKKEEGRGEESGETKKEGEEKIEGDIIVELRPNFVVNLTETYGTRLLRAEIGFKVSTEEVKQEVEAAAKIPIRDFIINELSKVRIEDIDNEVGKNRLKRTLRRGLNAMLKKGQIAEVYFSEFVIK